MPHVFEHAPSGRAKCRGCDAVIAKGALRFGERLPNPYGDGPIGDSGTLEPLASNMSQPSTTSWAGSRNLSRSNSRSSSGSGVYSSPCIPRIIVALLSAACSLPVSPGPASARKPNRFLPRALRGGKAVRFASPPRIKA